MKPWSPFLLAVALLTRLPAPRAIPPGAEKNLPELDRRLGQSVGYFPLVGLILGALAWGFLALADAAFSTQLSPRLTAAIVLTLWAIATGALHWDGFADTIDAMGVRRHGKERMLEVMKDPHTGSFAVVGVCLAVLVQWESLSELIAFKQWRLVAIAPIVSRWSMAHICCLGKPARDGGLGKVYLGRASLWSLALATVLCGGTSGWLYPQPLCLVVLLTAVVCSSVGLWWSGRVLGGQTGDVLGFVCVTSETVALATLAIAR